MTDSARLAQSGSTQIESIFGFLAAQRSAANAALGEAISNTLLDTSITIVGTYAVAWAAGATNAARLAATGRSLYATARSWQEVNAIASSVAAYQGYANVVKNVAGFGVSVGYGLGVANDIREAGLNSGAAFVDSAMGFEFGQSGLALGLTQATADYIKDLGLSSAQVSGVVNTITQSVAQTQGKIDQRLEAALSECDKQFK